MEKFLGSVKNRVALLFIFSGLIILLNACAPGAGNVDETSVEIRVAILPIIDALPMYVAEKQGFFSANGVTVTFIPAASAAERDQLISAEQADAMINDLLSVALYNKQSIQVQTVRFAMTATKDTPMFRVLAAKDSGLTSAADLSGVPIGISQGTVIDYVTTRLLENEGVSAEQIQSVAVPKMSERMALLESGEVKAATLPEPFGTMAEQGGAISIVDDSKYPEYGYSVISFHKDFIDQHPDAVAGFLKAIEQAVTEINKDPETWRPLLAEYKLVPEPLLASFPLPLFPTSSVPSEEQFNDVVTWARNRQLIDTELVYSDSVVDKYLSK